MSGDLTQELPVDIQGQILAELRSFNARMASVESGMASVESRVASIESHITSVEGRLTSLESRFTSLEGRLTSLEVRLTSLESTIQERQFDTKPIWERALAEIVDVRSDTREMKRNLRTLNDNMMGIQGNLREMDERLAHLEGQGSHT
ncbi:MAG TPA: hypothetical protein VJX67_09850 [Blastocatellia bacterium]|nr:hypothetical protein [Blastocatellia bacterium]